MRFMGAIPSPHTLQSILETASIDVVSGTDMLGRLRRLILGEEPARANWRDDPQAPVIKG